MLSPSFYWTSLGDPGKDGADGVPGVDGMDGIPGSKGRYFAYQSLKLSHSA